MIDWGQIATQIPAVAVIAFLVIRFLAIVSRFLDHLEKRDALLVTISDNCHATTDRSSRALDDCTKAVTELRIALNGGRRPAAPSPPGH